MFVGISYMLHNLVHVSHIAAFSEIRDPKVVYHPMKKLLRWALKGRQPVRLIWQLCLLLVISIVLFVIRQPKVLSSLIMTYKYICGYQNACRDRCGCKQTR